MFAHGCVVLLALFSLTDAAEPDCEELTKPVEDRSKLSGKWILYAGTSDCADALIELTLVNSSWIELSTPSESGDMILRYADRVGGKCYHGSTNTTFDGNVCRATFHYNSTIREYLGKHLKTCPDCILWVDSINKSESKVCRSIYLFTKTGNVSDTDKEVFMKQMQCLNFTSKLFFTENTDLCPDEKEVEADATKVKQ